MSLIVSMVVRNEANRHLGRVLENVRDMGAQCYVTDDSSTDDTVEICEAYGCVVQRTPEPLFWKHEGKARQRHLEWMDQFMTLGDWVLALDADETVSALDALPQAIRSAEILGDRAISLPLYEFWSEDQYRIDGYWFGTNAPVLYKWQPEGVIADKEMGCGREPTYVRNVQVFRQTVVHLQHWGYLRPEDRIRKHHAYTERLGGHGHNNSHVASIITEPTLRRYERR